jgi:hypothetical protein
MIIYMLETRRGSPNGFGAKRYHKGRHYDIPHTLAASFLKNGWAIEVPDEDVHSGVNGVRL